MYITKYEKYEVEVRSETSSKYQNGTEMQERKKKIASTATTTFGFGGTPALSRFEGEGEIPRFGHQVL